ncbi:16S rRNA (adenine(1518)-N(6)/adenine(1519)-N(6))-dimethyltransferase RsmA [Tumidithrix elongata RA019]|uniref:Ribosomal RNA small subunit methyltransferase A n=1 Tax=Tumidithrix elongata BACA0141 TaxID=2716417 RepID=A0AAW9Q0D3_9CYAN|nr:16S rRNA (adenine(1518)-N(6)/adenine(1519)-N(6))-dimethyltransferase RsmA [Tumidithrix elongata RA019]
MLLTIRPRKQFGQHWLRSDKALNKILQASQLSESDRILEIGPGTGNLTRLLLPRVKTVTAVEIDRDLCQQLRQKFAKDLFPKNLTESARLELIEASILEIPLPAYTNKVVANIPYNITGEILEKLLGSIAQPQPQFERVVLLVQKEIADRLVAKAGHKAYGALSVRMQYLAECQFVCDVPAQAFYPVPKVNSAVVCLLPRSPIQPASDPKALETLIKMGFATRRKMLRNNLMSLIDRDRLVVLLEEMQIDPQVRAEDLSVAQWVSLNEAILAM